MKFKTISQLQDEISENEKKLKYYEDRINQLDEKDINNMESIIRSIKQLTDELDRLEAHYGEKADWEGWE